MTLFGGEYLCLMSKALEYDPYAFRLLEVLEYKSLMYRKYSRKDQQKKYQKEIEIILGWLSKHEPNKAKLSEQGREYIMGKLEK